MIKFIKIQKMEKFPMPLRHLKFTTAILDYIFIVLLVIVVGVGFYEFVSVLYMQITSGKTDFMPLLGSLFVVLIGLELLKLSLTAKRGGLNFYIIAILDIVMIALARKIILLSPKTIIDIYEYFAIGFIMLVILMIIKFMPAPFALTLKNQLHLYTIVKDEVGALNKVTYLLKNLNINLSKVEVVPIGDGKSSLNATLDLKNTNLTEDEIEEKLGELDVVFKAKVR